MSLPTWLGIFILGAACGVSGVLAVACLLHERPDDYSDLQSTPLHLRKRFTDARRAR